MGDCPSRFSDDSSSLTSESPEINDRYFKYLKFDADHLKFLIKRKKLKSLNSEKLYIDDKYREFIQKSEMCPSKPRGTDLTIEIQKAKNLQKPGFFTMQGEPFIGVSLEPCGFYQETSISDLLNPRWYRVIQFKTLVRFKTLKITVKFKGDEFDGSFCIDFDEVKSQEVVDKWFHVNGINNDLSAVKVRVQCIHNEKTRYIDLAELCSKYSLMIDQAISDILNTPQ